MELQISYRLHTEILKAGNLSADLSGHRTDHPGAMPEERGRDHTGSGAKRSYPSIRGNSTEVERSVRSRISKGQKQPNDLRPARKSQV